MAKTAILCRSLGKQCGISEYSIALGKRLNVPVFSSLKEARNAEILIVQYEPSLYGGEAPEIGAQKTLLDLHIEGQEAVDLVSRYADIATIGMKRDPLPGAVRLRHINYPPVTWLRKPTEIRLGTCGFALPNKNFADVIELSKKLGLPATIIAPVATATSGIAQLSASYQELLLRQTEGSMVYVVTAFLSRDEVVRILSECTHLVSFMEDQGRASGSLRMMALAERPIISTPSFGAFEVRTVIVNEPSEITPTLLSRDLPLPTPSDGLPDYLTVLANMRAR